MSGLGEGGGRAGLYDSGWTASLAVEVRTVIKRILVGGAAGALATIPQSAVVWGLRRAGVYRRRPAPEVVAEGVIERVAGIGHLPAEWRRPVTLVQHFGFGAVGGAVFALLTGLVRPSAALGLLAGLAIWKASYDGWIPALKIMPPPQEDETGRQLSLLAAHAVYGLALGTLVDWMGGRGRR